MPGNCLRKDSVALLGHRLARHGYRIYIFIAELTIKKFFIAFLMCIFSVAALAVDKLPEEKGAAETERSKLIILRSRNSPPIAYKPMIVINGTKAFHLPVGYHAELDMNPGKYHIKADWKLRHGVKDQELDVELKPGMTTYVQVITSLEVAMAVTGSAVPIGSIQELKQADLNNSRGVSRFDPQWSSGAVGGVARVKTLNEHYELTVNNEKIIDDFQKGGDAKKLEIVRYLINREIYEEEILAVVESHILENYKTTYKNKEEMQHLIFECKYIASSRMPEFKPTLYEVKNGSVNMPLRKYAQSFLASYFGE